MFDPNYALTHKFIKDLVRFEKNRTLIENKELSSQSLNELSKISKAKDIMHFAHIIGVDLTIKDSEKAAEGKKIFTDDYRGIILNNFRNAYEYLRSNIKSSYIDLNINVLLHINKLLLTEWRQSWDIKLRSNEEEIEDKLDNYISLRDHAISPVRIQNELLSIFDWYKSQENKVSDIIRIAVVYYRMIIISPLMLLNKLTILMVIDFLFLKNGYIDKTFFSIYRNFDLHEQEYLEAIAYAKENSDDLTLFIERFIGALAMDIEDTQHVVQDNINQGQKASKQPFLDLNKRQLKILRYLQTIPTVKREDYVQMMDVSSMTSFRDLNDLVKKKLLKVNGKGRATKYMLSTR